MRACAWLAVLALIPAACGFKAEDIKVPENPEARRSPLAARLP